MRKDIKRIITLIAVTVLAALCMAVVVACGNDRALQKLPTPDKPERNGSIVTWNDDPLYADFIVSVDGTEYKTNGNSLDVAFALQEEKAFDVKVKAVGDGKYYSDSGWSETLTVPQITPLALSMELTTNKNAYKIKKCIQAAGDIVLPQIFNGLPVTEIGNGAFKECNDITSVTIPTGIEFIAASAFKECVNLESVIIPDTVETIFDSAFAKCEKLKTINIPKSVSSVGYNIFRQSGMTNLTIDADNPYYRAEGNCLIRKSDNAVVFANENSTIPSDVDTIAQDAIWSDNVETLVIPNGVKKLKQYFVQSNNLKHVDIPASVTDIESNAFSSSRNISEFVVSQDNPIYKSDCGHIIRKSDNVLISGCGGNVVIPDYVTGIAERAFDGRNTQSTLFIPKSVTWIGMHAFIRCQNLEYVYLPNTLVELGSSAFEKNIAGGYCASGLRSMTVPEGCVLGNMGWVITYSSPNCEIGYDNGYAYVYSISRTILSANYNLHGVIHWDDYADELPYRYGYTFGGYSATPDGEPITTAEEIEQIAYKDGAEVKVRVYPIWIAND